jgi:hypothetical protein
MTRVCGENVAVTRTGRKDCGQEKKILVGRERRERGEGKGKIRELLYGMLYTTAVLHMLSRSAAP